MEIKLETFEAHTADPAIVGAHYATKINGTVEVVFNKKTIRVYANQTRYGFYVYGFCGKYRTGTKIWNATVSLGHNGKASATFGRDEVNSNCYKINGVFYAPEIFFAA